MQYRWNQVPRGVRSAAHGVASALVVVAALSGALLSAPARADDFALRSIEAQDHVLTIEGDADLARLDSEIRRQASDAIRNAVPDLFKGATIPPLRYVNVTVNVTDVQFKTGATPHEIVVGVTVKIRADRERLRPIWRGIHSRVDWTPDGNADVAEIRLDGRIVLNPDGASLLKASALLDHISVQVLLQLFNDLFNGVTVQHAFGGRQIGCSFNVTPGAYRTDGITLTSFGVTAIQGKTAQVRLVLTLPPPDPAPADAGTPPS
jgi:hypothetical protein